MKYYYTVKLENGVFGSELKNLLDIAVRIGDIIGHYTRGYECVHFETGSYYSGIVSKLTRNGYEVTRIG